MKAEPRQTHVSGLRRDGQATQDQSKLSGVLSLDAGRRATKEESLQTLVPELQDRHRSSVTRNVSGYERLPCSSFPNLPAPVILRGTLSRERPERSRHESQGLRMRAVLEVPQH